MKEGMNMLYKIAPLARHTWRHTFRFLASRIIREMGNKVIEEWKTLSEIAVRRRLDKGRALIRADVNCCRSGKARSLCSCLGSVPLAEGNDLAVTLRQYLYMVLKRRWLILGIALAFIVLGGVRTLLQTPLYTATVRIQIEREPAKVVEGGTPRRSKLEAPTS